MATAYPSVEDYTSLEEHQSQTPQTFFGGKPVLYSHHSDCRLAASSEDLAALSDFGSLSQLAEPTQVNGENSSNNADDTELHKVISRGIEIFVSSQDVILANRLPAEDPKVLRIPYRAISIHATQRLYPTDSSGLTYTRGSAGTEVTPVNAILLYLDPQYETRANQEFDEDAVSQDVALTIIPPQGDDNANEQASQSLFEALSKGADLYPDPDMADDEEHGGIIGGGEPGEGGWITAENAQGFEDAEEGAQELLGSGAGARRDHSMVDGDAEAEDDESKWQRTG